MRDEEEIHFLGQAFDWYILEKWDSSTPIEEGPERRHKHIELGLAYAALGHEGRRPYVLSASKWRYGDKDTNSLPRSLNEVPRDLLSTSERSLHTSDPIWIRTDYGPGTDSRFKELVKGHEDYDFIYFDIMDNSERYDFTGHDERAMFAYFPALLESCDAIYEDEDVSFDSDEVQGRLFGTKQARDMGMAEEDLHSASQRYFFVADNEAMRTGYVCWVIPDQYGRPLFDERVQPWNLRDIWAVHFEYTLEELRRNVEKGYYGDHQKRHGYFVEPWEPPKTSVLPIR